MNSISNFCKCSLYIFDDLTLHNPDRDEIKYHPVEPHGPKGSNNISTHAILKGSNHFR